MTKTIFRESGVVNLSSIVRHRPGGILYVDVRPLLDRCWGCARVRAYIWWRTVQYHYVYCTVLYSLIQYCTRKCTVQYTVISFLCTPVTVLCAGRGRPLWYFRNPAWTTGFRCLSHTIQVRFSSASHSREQICTSTVRTKKTFLLFFFSFIYCTLPYTYSTILDCSVL